MQSRPDSYLTVSEFSIIYGFYRYRLRTRIWYDSHGLTEADSKRAWGSLRDVYVTTLTNTDNPNNTAPEGAIQSTSPSPGNHHA